MRQLGVVEEEAAGRGVGRALEADGVVEEQQFEPRRLGDVLMVCRDARVEPVVDIELVHGQVTVNGNGDDVQVEPQITSIYRRFGLNDRQIEILARGTPKRD
jgi:hypothetical protein